MTRSRTLVFRWKLVLSQFVEHLRLKDLLGPSWVEHSACRTTSVFPNSAVFLCDPSYDAGSVKLVRHAIYGIRIIGSSPGGELIAAKKDNIEPSPQQVYQGFDRQKQVGSQRFTRSPAKTLDGLDSDSISLAPAWMIRCASPKTPEL
jgi:hypothetical protein